MVTHLSLLIGLALLLSGCGGGSGGGNELPVILGAIPLLKYAMNITVGDLLRHDGGTRLATYLEGITAAGHGPLIRLPICEDWRADYLANPDPRIYPYMMGPIALDQFIPVLKAKGVKLLWILSHGAHEGVLNPERTIAWLHYAAPRLRPYLAGVSVFNEQWVVAGGNNRRFEPMAAARFHNQIAPEIRAVLPGVPIIEGDLSVLNGSESFGWWDHVQRAGVDVDVISLHPYEHDIGKLKAYYQSVKALCGPDRRFQITECDRYRHLDEGLAAGLNIEECYLYSWNGTDAYARRPGGGILA